jgi:hypothetical protein
MGFQPMLNDFHLQLMFQTSNNPLEAQRSALHSSIACYSKISWHRERRAWIHEPGASFGQRKKCLHGLEAHVTDALLVQFVL